MHCLHILDPRLHKLHIAKSSIKSLVNIMHMKKADIIIPSVLQEVLALPFVTTFWERNLPSVDGFLKFLGVSTFLSAAAAAGLVAYKKGIIPRS